MQDANMDIAEREEEDEQDLILESILALNRERRHSEEASNFLITPISFYLSLPLSCACQKSTSTSRLMPITSTSFLTNYTFP